MLTLTLLVILAASLILLWLFNQLAKEDEVEEKSVFLIVGSEGAKDRIQDLAGEVIRGLADEFGKVTEEVLDDRVKTTYDFPSKSVLMVRFTKGPWTGIVSEEDVVNSFERLLEDETPNSQAIWVTPDSKIPAGKHLLVGRTKRVKILRIGASVGETQESWMETLITTNNEDFQKGVRGSRSLLKGMIRAWVACG